MSAHIPPPGLQGDHRGTCAVCMRPTDTGFGVRYREPEWVAAMFVVAWDDTVQMAATMMRAALADPRNRGGESGSFIIRCCRRCAKRANIPINVALLLRGQPMPTYTQPEEGER